MKSFVEYFIKYPVWANVLMFALLGFGYYSATSIRTSFFPESESSAVNISVSYPGTSPSEIEESVILVIERNLEGIEGVDYTSSRSIENSGSITVNALDKYDINDLLIDVKNAVDRTHLPAGAERPTVTVAPFRSRSNSIAIYGNADIWALKERARAFRDLLVREPGISQVEVDGVPGREIAIEVSEGDLRKYNISFNDIASAIQNSNLDVSGGKLETQFEEFIIRSYGRKNTAQEIGNIVVKSQADGTLLRVADLASISEKWEDSPNRTYYNGEPALMVNVDKTKSEDLIDITKKTYRIIEEFQEMHPEIKIKMVEDATIHLMERIDLLTKNGAIGFVLILLCLGFFLNLRVAFWVALGIPISFGGMFIVANLAGITINTMSLFGMIIVIGILVDDAIVVAEQVYQEHEGGISAYDAALKGTLRVISPVFTAVMTTVLAFLPFFFFEGQMGKMVWQLALVVIAALIFSLIESMLILPAHLAHSQGLNSNKAPSKFRQKAESFYLTMTHKIYSPALAWSMRHKLITLGVLVFCIFMTIGMFKGKILEFNAFPSIDRDNLRLSIAMTTGTPAETTDSILMAMEAKIIETNEELKSKRKDQKDVFLSTTRILGRNRLGDRGEHAGSIEIEMLPGSQRGIPAQKISAMLEKKIGQIPGAQKISFGRGGGWGKPVSLSLQSNDLHQLETAKNLLKQKLAEYPDLKEIMDSDTEGQREFHLSLKPAAKALGLSIKDIASQIRQGFFGQELQRLQRGEDEIRIWVRYSQADRNSEENLRQMYIRTPKGNIPLSELANWEIGRSRAIINHIDGKREVRVEADIDDPKVSPATLMEDISNNTLPQIYSQTTGVQISKEGQDRSNRNFARSLKQSFIPALLGILVILVLVFRSYLQAIIIMVMIPIGAMGAFWGHFFEGLMISQLSTYGILALTGIVINDSIVFIDQINNNLRKGMNIFDAIHNGGINRLRPILLTTFTTIAGLAPLIQETSFQAQFLIPMAVSVAYGMLFGSAFILFLVPTLMLTLNTLRYRMAQGWHVLYSWYNPSHIIPTITRESVEPAVKETLHHDYREV
jgi:multidrug efflux pump subunit AcrB